MPVRSHGPPEHHRDWHGECLSRGGPCWVHKEYPFLRSVGLAATLAAAALLFALLVKYAGKPREEAPSPT